MIERYHAVILLKTWGQSEKIELAAIDYPAVSPMFKDYLSGYRKSGVEVNLDDQNEMVGAAINNLHPAIRRTIRLEYVEGAKKIPRRARDLALNAFRREFASLPEDGSGLAT